MKPRILHSAFRQRGFALVISLLLMLLITLLSVGLLSLSAVSLRSAGASEAMAVARSNARMAMMLAIGELQSATGPDQRVTGTADLTDAGATNPRWSAAWPTKGTDGPVWLVSGNENGRVDAASPGDVKLLKVADEEVSVAGVQVGEDGPLRGRFAWWIGDEGVKARVDLEAPEVGSSTDLLRYSRSRIGAETGVSRSVDALAGLGAGSDLDMRTILTPATLAVAGEARDVPDDHFHDLTAGGAALPVNVVTGGMKTDLSLVFDSSQATAGLTEEYLGASFTKKTIAGAPVQEPSVKNPRLFYLAPELSANGSNPAGPNWGNLYNYATLWSNVLNEASTPVALNPRPEADIRTSNWPPYRNVDKGSFKRDIQHTNSSLTPVLRYLQMGFRMRASGPGKSYTIDGRTGTDGYQMQLEMKPVIGLWNPHNVRISATPYRIDWALYPCLRIGLEDRTGKRIGTPRVWMREHWKSGTGGDTPETSQDRWFQLRTPSIDLQPGEFRLFSVTSQSKLADVNNLVAGWNEEGGFVFDLVYSRFDSQVNAGKPIVVPSGSLAWYGDLFLEDSQHEDTPKQFPGGFADGASASWVTLKGSGDSVIHRVADLWQTPRPGEKPGGNWRVPEQVISVADATDGRQNSPKILVEQLAASPWHIGTWAWNSRTTTEAVEGQTTRGWSDTNPRHAAANPLWDGSKLNSSGTYDGWYFNSSMLGGSWGSPTRPFSQTTINGDKGPGGRGKIAEGQLGDQEPEASVEGRYQGFGGASTTTSLGQNHVVLFDVPRSPLVSIGQFQHAHVARYGYEPSFPIGASYASPRLPLGSISSDNFAGVQGFRMADLSYILNRELWDGYFFSTIGTDYQSGSGSLDRNLPWESIRSGMTPLPNPRLRFVPRAGDTSLDKIVGEAGRRAPIELASRILIEGGFNVNSTSKTAWKAVLASMADFELPVIGTSGGKPSWESPEGVRFPRFGHVLTSNGWTKQAGSDPSFWRGYRSLGNDELDDLAEAIVAEVRERGPFRSFAEFVNRDPESQRQEDRLKGPLQAALDRTINAALPPEVGKPVTQPTGTSFSPAISGENQASGFAGYLSQGDILQCLAPVLGVRSDYFRVVTLGEASDARGTVLARARCEAFVQRLPDFVDRLDSPGARTADLQSPVNRKFGRRFQIVSFRWLAPTEA